MSQYIKTANAVDVMILAEGTYPYIRGGVSSWIAQLLQGLSHIRFGICFIGSQESDYEGLKYPLPDNLVHLEVHYMFGDDEPPVKKVKGDAKAFEAVSGLHRWFRHKEGEIPEVMKNISFYTEGVTFEHFLHSKNAWNYINERYKQNCPDVPFIDYFWALRNIHRPIWKLAAIIESLPQCSLFHAPSTGYAGFLGALASYHTGRPFILTEHGIYTRERKIDMLTADWVDFHKPTLLKQPEEVNYIKQMWVNFFERIGEFAYTRANPILSLYPGARDIQIAFGAPETVARVIPNGVDVDDLSEALEQRPDTVPRVVTLIGRVVSIKDIKTFIRAIRIVAHDLPDVQGWIVGPTDEDEEYATECMQMVDALGLRENVKFLGFQNIKEILPQSGLLTLTSISEGMPLVILEGFAAGIPCVATNVGSCKDLIHGALDEYDVALGSAGEITSIADTTALANAYLRFLTDADAWQQAQQIALERVNRYYRQELFLQSYDAIYIEAMEQPWQA